MKFWEEASINNGYTFCLLKDYRGEENHFEIFISKWFSFYI